MVQEVQFEKSSEQFEQPVSEQTRTEAVAGSQPWPLGMAAYAVQEAVEATRQKAAVSHTVQFEASAEQSRQPGDEQARMVLAAKSQPWPAGMAEKATQEWLAATKQKPARQAVQSELSAEQALQLEAVQGWTDLVARLHPVAGAKLVYAAQDEVAPIRQ